MTVRCVIVTSLIYREYKVDVKDRRFEPMILLIEQGDKVWFSWENTKDCHCVYQIEPPSPHHPTADEYKGVGCLLSFPVCISVIE